ncbi:MAG TPA: 30S ribosomal protein S20 [bacterium]|jgi:small subunit ribosomal protein S20|nr:30S ribosomal protein S20 [bacterium]
MPVRKPTVLKRQRQEEKKKKRNKIEKSKIKTIIKKARESVLNQDEKAGEKIKNALRSIDTAMAKNSIHKNTASRKKSRLAKFRNKYMAKNEKA